jgi:hypothetical protein
MADMVLFIQNLTTSKVDLGIWVIDPPYGLLKAKWDEPFSIDQWKDLFFKIKTVDKTTDPYVFIFSHTGILSNILAAAKLSGFVLAQRLAWFKPQTATTGAIPKYQNQLEDILIFIPKDGSSLYFSWAEGISEQGSNVLVYPAVKVHAKDGDGEILNPAEKPWQVLFRFIRTHFKEGSQVLLFFK